MEEKTKNLPCIIYKPQWTRTIIRGIIYKRTSPENKCYIGQTIDEHNRNRDWKDIKGKYAGIKIEKARKKFGPENFTYEILFEIKSFDKNKVMSILNEKEVYFIKKFDSFYNGYNSNSGGSSSMLNNKLEDKPVIQLSYGLKFIRYWDSIQSAAEYYNVRSYSIHQCCRRYERIVAVAKYRWIYVEDYEMYKDNLEDFMVESKCNRSGLVQLTLDGKFIKYWKVAMNVENELGLSLAHISDCCSGKRRQCGGFRWMYLSEWEKCDGNPDPIDFNYDKRSKKVIQFRLNGEFMKVWRSTKDAAKAFNLDHRAIKFCCRANAKNDKQSAYCSQYIWMFYDDYKKLNAKNLPSDTIKSNSNIRRKIVQINPIDNKVIKVWETITELYNKINIDINRVTFSLRLKNNRSGYLINGYIWRFEPDYIEEQLGLDPESLKQEKNL